MKKTYIQPSTMATEISIESLICVSVLNGKADNSTVLSKDRDIESDLADDDEDLW